MPPAADAMKTLRPLTRSSTMPRYSSRAMGSVSSISSRCTFLPSGPVWCVTSFMPEHLGRELAGFFGRLGDLDAAALAAAAGMNLRFDDDAGGAVAQQPCAASSASSRVSTICPRGTATPYFDRMAFPWYS